MAIDSMSDLLCMFETANVGCSQHSSVTIHQEYIVVWQGHML